MLIIAHETDRGQYADLFDQMYRLRAREFGLRRGWRVEVVDGRERDHFDDLNPLYVCVATEEGRLLASLRLLPTTGPHMLSDIFPEVMGEAGIVRHPLILEVSRLCVDTAFARDFGPGGINRVTRELLTGLFTTALQAGMSDLIAVYDLYVERILRMAGCRFERLGPVQTYDDLRTVGGLFEVSGEVIGTLQERSALAA